MENQQQRNIPTELQINGPILSFVTDPSNVTVSTGQTVIFTGLATATLLSMRRWVKGVFRGRERRGADEEVSIGEFAEVIEAISPSRPGRIRFKGTTWGAISKKGVFEIGDYVQIVESNNITFIVEKKSNNDVV